MTSPEDLYKVDKWADAVIRDGGSFKSNTDDIRAAQFIKCVMSGQKTDNIWRHINHNGKSFAIKVANEDKPTMDHWWRSMMEKRNKETEAANLAVGVANTRLLREEQRMQKLRQQYETLHRERNTLEAKLKTAQSIKASETKPKVSVEEAMPAFLKYEKMCEDWTPSEQGQAVLEIGRLIREALK